MTYSGGTAALFSAIAPPAFAPTSASRAAPPVVGPPYQATAPVPNPIPATRANTPMVFTSFDVSMVVNTSSVRVMTETGMTWDAVGPASDAAEFAVAATSEADTSAANAPPARAAAGATPRRRSR